MSEERAERPPTHPGDQPITCMAEDAMEWGRHIYALLRTLERAETPFLLGVYGGWGSGKTSFVNCLGDAGAVDPLIERLADEARGVREAAVDALGNLGAAAASGLPRLGEVAADDEDDSVRRVAAAAIAEIEAAIVAETEGDRES